MTFIPVMFTAQADVFPLLLAKEEVMSYSEVRY